MQVHIVRSADPGCEPTCAEWIAAQGRIDATTLGQFKKVLSQLGKRQLPILIDSAGGAVDEALAIGRLIRAKGLDVAVTKTELTPCAPADTGCRKSKANGALLGRPKAHLSKCASSCAFVLAGGKRRYVGPATFVGVHQITSFETRVKVLRTYRVETRREWGIPVATTKTLVSEKRIAEKTTLTPTKETDYQKIARYFAEMGVGEGVMRALLVTPSTSIHWFSRAELVATSMATELMDGQQLVTGVVTPRMAGPATAPASLVPPVNGRHHDPMGLKGLCGAAGGILIACPSGPVGAGSVNPGAAFITPGTPIQLSPKAATPATSGTGEAPVQATTDR